MNEHEKINYIEFPAKDINATKSFFTEVFGWSFVDYGPEYSAFSNEGIDGGFFKSNCLFLQKVAAPSSFFTVAAWKKLKRKSRVPAVQSLDPFAHFQVAGASIFPIQMAMSLRSGLTVMPNVSDSRCVFRCM